MRRYLADLALLIAMFVVPSCGISPPGSLSLAPNLAPPHMVIQGGSHLVVVAEDTLQPSPHVAELDPATKTKVIQKSDAPRHKDKFGAAQVTVDDELVQLIGKEELEKMWHEGKVGKD